MNLDRLLQEGKSSDEVSSFVKVSGHDYDCSSSSQNEVDASLSSSPAASSSSAFFFEETNDYEEEVDEERKLTPPSPANSSFASESTDVLT